MHKRLLFVFLLVVFALPSYAAWVDVHSGVTSRLSRVSMFDSQNGFVVGDDGILLRTVNGGKNWSTVSTATTDAFWDVKCINASQAYVSDQTSNSIYKFAVTDTLTIKNAFGLPPSPLASKPFSIFIQDENTAYIFAQGAPQILKTTNEGVTWNPFYSIFGSESVKSGVVVGDKIFATDVNSLGRAIFSINTDGTGGQPLYYSLGSINDVFDMQSYGKSIWAIGFDGVLISSNNSGLNWTLHNVQTFSPYAFSTRLANEKIGWVAGISRTIGMTTIPGGIYRTFDGGNTWQLQKSGEFYGLDITRNPIKLIAVGDAGTISILAPPILSSISKTQFVQGTIETISIIGTGFETGESIFGTVLPTFQTNRNGISFESINVISSTEIQARIKVDSDADIGSVDLTLVNIDTTQTTESNAFAIGAGPQGMMLTSLVPGIVYPGTNSQSVGINGTNIPNPGTNGTWEADFGAGITVKSIGWRSNTQIVAVVSVDANAVPGTRNITITIKTSSGEVVATASKAAGFVVQASPAAGDNSVDVVPIGGSWNPDLGPAIVQVKTKEPGIYNVMLLGTAGISYKTSQYLNRGINKVTIPGTAGTNSIQSLSAGGHATQLSNGIYLVAFEKDGKISKAKMAIAR